MPGEFPRRVAAGNNPSEVGGTTVRCFSNRCLMLCSPILIIVGCSTTPQMDYSKVDLVNVTGTVTLDGQPLPNAVITFDSVEDGSFAFAQTDSSGRYQLQFDTVKNGVTTGKKQVQISTTRRILGLNTENEAGGEDSDEASAAEGPAEEAVPECYNKQTKIQVEVTSATTTFDFDLKSDCSTTGATL